MITQSNPVADHDMDEMNPHRGTDQHAETATLPVAAESQGSARNVGPDPGVGLGARIGAGQVGPDCAVASLGSAAATHQTSPPSESSPRRESVSGRTNGAFSSARSVGVIGRLSI
jgi:hypothetical protein